MQFSLRRLLGWMMLGCVSLGATLAFGPRGSGLGVFLDFIPAVIRIASAILAVLAGYAALEPWLGYPSSLDKKWPQVEGQEVSTGPLVLAMAVVLASILGLPGGLLALLMVEDGWSMDTGGASAIEWIFGAPLIVWETVGISVLGASIAGMFALFCGSTLGRGFARVFWLCAATIVAAMLAFPMYWLGAKIGGSFGGGGAAKFTAGKLGGNLLAGTTGVAILFAGWWLSGRYVRRIVGLGRHARRWAARAFLGGYVLGAVVMTIVQATVFTRLELRVALLIGGIAGSFTLGVVGLLVGAIWEPTPAATESPFAEVPSSPQE